MRNSTSESVIYSTSGFSLVQLSVLLAVMGVMTVAILPGQDAGDPNAKLLLTHERMVAIEKATLGYMTENGHRPCPADATAVVGSTTFGREAANAGSCTGGSPAANFVGSAGNANVVAGGIPNVALTLPDEYAFDGFGRRFTYVVDKRATDKEACVTLQGGSVPDPTATGDIEIRDSVAGTLLNRTMWALLSHGQDAHGAFAMQGGQINTGNTDADTRKNGSVDGSFAAVFTKVFVKKERTDTFDDFTWLSQGTRNTCCLGAICAPPSKAIRLDGDLADDNSGYRLAVGDINADGTKDMIIAAHTYQFGGGCAAGAVYVIFGQSSGLPTESTPLITGAGEILDGTKGFRIVGEGGCDLFGASVAADDINADGLDDLVIGSELGFSANPIAPGAVYVIYGGATRKDGAAWAATQVADSTFLNGSGTAVNGFRLDGEWGSGFFGASVATGDINGDGDKDVIVGAYDTNFYGTNREGSAYVIYGGPTSKDGNPWAVSQLPNAAWLAGGGTAVNGFRLDGESWNRLGTNVAAGDINGDGKDELIIKPFYMDSVQVVWGKSSEAAAVQILNDTYLAGGGTAVNGFRLSGPPSSLFGGNITVGNFKSNSKEDLIIGANTAGYNGLDAGAAYVVYGKAIGWATAQTVDDTWLDGGGTAVNGFRLDGENAGDQLGRGVGVGDINNDGRDDILIGSRVPGSNSDAGSSTFVVFGKTGGWAASQTLNTSFLSSGSVGFRLDGEGTTETYWIGSALASGDFNADGKAELLIGAYVADPDGRTNAGSTFLIFGKSGGWEVTEDISDMMD